jgi:hypothetical protein
MRVSVKPLVANNFEAAIQTPCIPLHTKTITEKHMKKAITTAQKIKNMIQAGFPNAEIMKAIPKATSQQISNHRYLMKKNAKADKFVAAVLTKSKKIEAGMKIKKEILEEILLERANEVQVGGQHYKSKGIQPWDAIHAWGLGFFSGNVVKYVARHREKNGVEDLKKARHYLDKLIEIMEAK